MHSLHINYVLVGAYVIILCIGMFFALEYAEKRIEAAVEFFSNALRDAHVQSEVSIHGTRYFVVDGSVHAGNATTTGVVALPVLELAYAQALARRSPIFGIAGTDPATLKASIQALSVSLQEVADTATSTRDSLLIRSSLYPISFLSSLADLEEARLRFVTSGSQANALEYRLALRRTASAGRADAARFNAALKQFFGNKNFVISGLGGTMSVDRIVYAAESIVRAMKVVSDRIRARDACVQGDTSKCDMEDLSFKLPVDTVADNNALSPLPPLPREHRDMLAHAGAGIDTHPQTIVALDSSRCLGALKSPYYVNSWHLPGDTVSFFFIGELFFIKNAGSNGNVPRFLEEKRGMAYTLVNPLTFYMCPDVQDDEGRARAVLAAISYARSHPFATSARNNLLTSPDVVHEGAALWYVRALLREAAQKNSRMTAEDVRDAEDLALMFQDKNAGLDALVNEVARINSTDVRLWHSGVPFDLRVRSMFLTHSGFLSFFLAHNILEPHVYETFRTKSEENTALLYKRIIPYSQLRYSVSREKILADIRSFFSFERD